MSLDSLDPVLNAPKRLAALGVITNAKKVEFSFLSQHFQLSDSDLSKQMSALVDARYVTANKVGKGRTRKTWYTATAAGRRALATHVAALNALATSQAAPDPTPADTPGQ